MGEEMIKLDGKKLETRKYVRKTLMKKFINYCRKKSPWMLHFNSGGCLPYSAEIIVGDKIVSIGDLADSFGTESSIKNEKEIESILVEGETQSFENFRPKMKELYAVHRLKSPKKLVKIETTSGVPVTLTPKHKVLVDREVKPVWIEAEKIKKGDYLFCPRVLKIKPEIPHILDTLPGYLVAHISKNTLKFLKREIIKKYGNAGIASKELNIPKIRFSDKKRAFNIRELKILSEDLGIEWSVLKEEVKRVSAKGFKFSLNQKIDKNLMYMLGLIASDGYITLCRSNLKHKGSYKINFANNNRYIVKQFEKSVKKFSPEKKISKDISTRSGTPIRYLYSNLLASIAAYFGIKPKANDFKPVFGLPESYIAHFLAGYFDGDGHISLYNNDKRFEIGIATSDFLVAKRLFMLLKRLGIASKIISSMNRSTFGTKKMYRVSVVTQTDANEFIKKIPVRHPKKNERVKKLRKILKNRKKHDMSTLSFSPISCNFIIKEARKRSNLKQADLYAPPIISAMENGKRLMKKTVENIYCTFREKTKSNIETVENMLNSEYYIDRVSDINYIEQEGDIVYNLSVRDTECYTPEGMFVVKNCNGCDIELIASITPRFDLERFGMLLKGSPRHADILMVEGPVTSKVKSRLITIYQQMPEPKLVLAIGACPLTKGIFQDCYNVVGPLDKFIPVDVYVPGCPPKPEAIIQGLIKILRKM